MLKTPCVPDTFREAPHLNRKHTPSLHRLHFYELKPTYPVYSRAEMLLNRVLFLVAGVASLGAAAPIAGK
jgi:hypothetical protein